MYKYNPYSILFVFIYLHTLNAFLLSGNNNNLLLLISPLLLSSSLAHFPLLQLLSFLFIYHVQIIAIYLSITFWAAFLEYGLLSLHCNDEEISAYHYHKYLLIFFFCYFNLLSYVLLKARLYNFSSFWCHVLLSWAQAVEVYRWDGSPIQRFLNHLSLHYFFYFHEKFLSLSWFVL